MQLLPDSYYNFALIAAPLFKLTRKDSGYKLGPLPEATKLAFLTLQKLLILEPVMAFPKSNHQYGQIMDAATRRAATLVGLGAILTQVNINGKIYTISFASRQFKDIKKLLTFPSGNCHCSMVDGHFQQNKAGRPGQ
jgi:hypothetical protein